MHPWEVRAQKELYEPGDEAEEAVAMHRAYDGEDEPWMDDPVRSSGCQSRSGDSDW